VVDCTINAVVTVTILNGTDCPQSPPSSTWLSSASTLRSFIAEIFSFMLSSKLSPKRQTFNNTFLKELNRGVVAAYLEVKAAMDVANSLCDERNFIFVQYGLQ